LLLCVLRIFGVLRISHNNILSSGSAFGGAAKEEHQAREIVSPTTLCKAVTN
jgi:hypothetical protein